VERFEARRKNPPVDKNRANSFSKDDDSANERFEQDVVENDGNPLFLRNQLVQKWVVPYWKSDAGEPMAYCCICSNEAWSPVHFYSKHHLKHCMSNPQTWEATWKYPRSNFTCVGDFEDGPETMHPDDLMAIPDCPTAMLSWAATHLKLSKKPGNNEAASSNLDVQTQEHFFQDILDQAEKIYDDKVLDICTQLDLQSEQLDLQSNFIGLLEGQVVTAKTRGQDEGASMLRAQKEVNRKLWHEIRTLKDKTMAASQRILDLETALEEKMSVADEKKNEKCTCFSGIMRWCRSGSIGSS